MPKRTSDNPDSVTESVSSKKEIIKNEQTFLRTELQELKRCQLQYFITSIAGTGIIFGLLDKPDKDNAMFFLAPLIILVPCWWTFFDKATTITRLVGYSVFLEGELASGDPKYKGYERSLKNFRSLENRLRHKCKKLYRKRLIKNFKSNPIKCSLNLIIKWLKAIWGTLKLLGLRTRHRYWIINWYTYFALCLVCCLSPILKFQIYPFPFTLEKAPLWIAIIIVFLSAIYTLNVIFHLIHGKYAYERVARFWFKKVLNPREPKRNVLPKP